MADAKPTDTPTPEVKGTTQDAVVKKEPFQEKPKRRFPLPSLPFRKKKEETSAENEVEELKTEVITDPLEPDEVINMLDPHIKISDEPETAKLERKLNETIDQTKDKHAVSININLSKILLIAGLLLFLYPAYLFVPSLVRSDQFSSLKSRIPFLNQPTDSSENSIEESDGSGEPSDASTSAQIRIRFEPEQLQTRDAIRALLVNAGYANIELVEDSELEQGIELAGKTDNTSLRDSLYQLLTQSYSISSESAILSTDSDFDAAILIGKQ